MKTSIEQMNGRARPRASRWRAAFFLLLIVLVQGSFAYLVSRIEPPRPTCFVPITISEYQARPLAAAAFAGEPACWQDGKLTPQVVRVGSTRQDIVLALEALGKRDGGPLVLYVSALAVQADEGAVYLLPSDATPEDAWTWLRLRDVLVRLQGCPARQKLLVLDLTPAVRSPRLGNLHDDVAAALPGELAAVPDAERWVLCSCAPGQTPHFSSQAGQSIFAFYFQQGLRGDADGWDSMRDGHVSVKELAGFVQNRVEHWTWRNRGERQTPMLAQAGKDFPLLNVEPAGDALQPASARAYPDWLLEGWKARDAAYQSGEYRLATRLFLRQQAILHAAESAWRAGIPDKRLRKEWFVAWERSRDSFQRLTRDIGMASSSVGVPSASARKTFGKFWAQLQQQSANLKPDEADRLKTRLIDELRAKLTATDLDAVVYAHALSEGRFDPGTLLLYDRILHPSPQTLPCSEGGLRLRQLADLAMRVEAVAWPAELIEKMLRAGERDVKAARAMPNLLSYHSLLEKSAHHLHEGEIRLWTRGYADLETARNHIAIASEQYDRLTDANERWGALERLRGETLVELSAYATLLERMPHLRENWSKAASGIRTMADMLQTLARDDAQAESSMQKRLKEIETIHAGIDLRRREFRKLFAAEEISSLDRQCRGPEGDAGTLRRVEALLEVSGPILRATDRATLCEAAQILERRLHEETLSLQCGRNGTKSPPASADATAPAKEDATKTAAWRAQAQLTLCELAGVAAERLLPVRHALERCEREPKNIAAWCDLGAMLQRLLSEQIPEQYRHETGWSQRERLVLALPLLDALAGIDDVAATPALLCLRDALERRERWRAGRDRYLARDYQGLNFECPGIQAARKFYARQSQAHAGNSQDEPHVRLRMQSPLEPLTQKQPYAHGWLEVTRLVPPGKFGPVELEIHRAEEAWLEIAPHTTTLPALRTLKEPRTLLSKVPFKVTRNTAAERTGLPAPLGFLVEAKFEGRSYHHLVTTPILPDTREVQIFVSADADAPGKTESAIRVRPGTAKQAHYFYLQNLTNRPNKVHVDIVAGAHTLYKSRQPLALDPDALRKVAFDDGVPLKVKDLREPLQVLVFDQDRHKVLATRTVPVSILAPHEYVTVAEVAYQPGGAANNKWFAQVQTAQRAGPAIAAELVLPVQRIPGLIGVGGGTLHVEIPTQADKSRTLFAEKIQLADGFEQEGPVYLNIDGVPRAFVYRTNFAGLGESNRPRRDIAPAVRLSAPICIMAGINYLVDVEVDNAPAGAKLEVALGRHFDGEGFKAEIVREFTDAKKQHIELEATRDALIFEASIQDWSTSFDTRAIVGARELRARLLDAAGKEIVCARQPVVIDNTPPIARFLPAPAPVKRGTVLQVQAEGLDPESGIDQVFFFLGAPVKGEIPPGAMKMKATPIDNNLWSISLLVPPEQKGALQLGVYVVNRAGLASADTIRIEIQERDPEKTGLGQIRGQVVEGPRPQPNLTVILTDEAGKEVARTRTLADGSFLFGKLPPGRYRLQCSKPESLRRASQGVIVEPDRMAQAALSLSL
jgi:hypothetical protein